MRNLKRVLSLTLASVMLLGMMVVGSSAAAGYDDVADTDNVEAIEVLQAIEVMVGDERGFGPERPVNRAEMAVVMGKLLSLDYNYYSATCPFDDVYDWARGWVGACAANKIVSGRGDGIYDPGSTVTAVEAASMLMRALGYFQYSNDYADGFEVSTVRLGTTIGIFDGVGSSATEPMTRNQVAQMVLNALQSAVVEPDGNTINLTTPDGTVYTGKVNYVSVTSARSFATAISRTQATSVGSQNDGWIVELGERLYDGKLELVNDDLDVFGRPARTWKFNGGEIGTYAKRELIINDGIFTEGVKGRTVYDMLGQTTIRDNDLYTFLDGHDNTITKNDLVRANNSNLAGTGRGVLTEIYLDTDLDKVTIVSINTYLAQATADYNSNSETISLTVYDSFGGITKLVDLEDVPGIASLKKDDWVLVNWADASSAHVNKTVVDMFQPEIMEDTKVTQFSRSDEEESGSYGEVGERVTGITTNGNNYSNNVNAWYKEATLYDYDANALVNKTYTLYLDQYGYFIGAELYSGANQYVFITGYDRPTSNLSVSTAKAGAIFTDGTMAAINVNVKDTNDNITAYLAKYPSRGTPTQYNLWADYDNQGGEPKEEMWYNYTLDGDVYTLTPVNGYTKELNTTALEETINCTNVRLIHDGDRHFGTGRSYGEEESVYITVDDGIVDTHPNAITEVTGVYTGVQNVNLVMNTNEWAHAVYDANNNYIVAAVVFGQAEGVVDNYAYIRSGVKNEKIESDGTHYWDFDAILNGELVTKTIKSKFSNTVSILTPGTVQELVLDADGYVTRIKNIEDSETGGTDKLYNNYDYRNNAASPAIDTYNVYDIDVRSDDFRNASHEQPNGIGITNGRKWSVLTLQGLTLHYDTGSDDIGLDFVRDAKAVVRQVVNNETKWTDNLTVSAAFSILADADNDSTNNKTNLKQFSGRVVAVLNSQGVAEWVFFYDDTPINSTAPDYSTGNNGNDTTLPNWTDLGVSDGTSDDVTVNGVYHKDTQKLYLQFSGLNGIKNSSSAAVAGASQVKLNDVTITERAFALAGSGAAMRTVTADITVDVQQNGVSKVVVLDFATINTNTLLPSSIEVTLADDEAKAPGAGTGVEILAWYVDYKADSDWASANAAYNTKQATVANRDGASIAFTVDLPTGYQNATYQGGTGLANVTMPTFVNVTGRTAYTAALTSAGVVRPVVAIGVDKTKLNIQEDSVLGQESRSDYTEAYNKAGLTIRTDAANKTTTIGGMNKETLENMLTSDIGKAQLALMEGTNQPGYLWVGATYQSPKVNGAYANTVTCKTYKDGATSATPVEIGQGENFNNGILHRWYGVAQLEKSDGAVTGVTTLPAATWKIELEWNFANGLKIAETYYLNREAPVTTTP